MEVKEFTFRLMLLGFPGICCYFLLKKLVGKIGSDVTEAVLSIFVLSLFCYFTTDLFFFLPRYVPRLPWSRPPVDFSLVKRLFGNNGQIGARSVLLTTLVSAPLVAGVISFLYRYKVWNGVCKKIGLTHRFGDEDLFNFILDAKQKPEWYVVRDHKENLVYYGAITHCSDEGTDRELLLTEVDVYSNERDVKHLYSCPSLYVCRKRDDISIEVALVKSSE
jgi:hypothetical protein